MPVYEYQCECGNRFDRYLPLVNYKDPQTCECGNIAAKRLSRPNIQGDSQGYDCPVTGKWIEGKKAHKDNLRRHGCHVLEAGEKSDVEKRRKQEELSLDKAVDSTVDEFIEKLPSKKREQLAREVAAGAAISINRA